MGETTKIRRTPVIDGPWRRICTTPGLGELASDKPDGENIVDHGFSTCRNPRGEELICAPSFIRKEGKTYCFYNSNSIHLPESTNTAATTPGH